MLALRTPSGKTVGAYQQKSWPLSGSQGPSPRIFNASPQSLRLLGGRIANYPELYWTQPWVHAVVNKLVRGVARLELKTYEYDDNRTPVEAPMSVPAKVLRAPYPRAGSFQLKEFIMGSLCVYGNATLIKFRGGAGRTPQELWPMPFSRVSIIEGRERPIEAYQYAGLNTAGAIGMKPLYFLPEDVVHFSWFNPDGKPWGRSPLEALATALALEDGGQRYALSSFANNARPSSFITSTNKMTKEQRDNLRNEIESAYGGPDNAFKVALLDNGLDWKPIGHSARDSSLIELRKLSREEVCAVYDIPPPLVGILDNATYSNISEQHVMLYQTTIAPILTALEDTLNAQFANEDAWAPLFQKFDMGDVVRGNLKERSESYQRLFMSGGLTPNEQRVMEGRKPIGNLEDEQNPANMIYVPVNTAPVGQEGMLTPLKAGVPEDPHGNLSAAQIAAIAAIVAPEGIAGATGATGTTGATAAPVPSGA